MLDKRRVLPCSVYLQGEYGIDGLFVGVPVKLGREGVRQIIELSLTAEESAALEKSAAAVQDLVDAMARLAAEGAYQERKAAGNANVPEPTTPLIERPWEDVERMLDVDSALEHVLSAFAPLERSRSPLLEAANHGPGGRRRSPATTCRRSAIRRWTATRCGRQTRSPRHGRRRHELAGRRSCGCRAARRASASAPVRRSGS